MGTEPIRNEILATELRVLQAMCTGTTEGTVRDEGMRMLRNYPFRDLVHQLIFDTLREINSDRPDVIRQQLASRLTRKGFPDVDTQKFFARHGLSREEAFGWMRKLQAWAKKKPAESARR